MLRKLTPCLLVFLLAFALFGPAPAAAERPVLSLAVTDLGGYAQLQQEFGPFAKALGRWAGCRIDFLPVRSRTAAVEALKQGRVDLVLTGPAEYVVFRALTDARPLVAFSRPDYFAGIVVLAERGPATVQGLKGRTVLFGDVGSTSNHLAPMQILADQGMDPLKDIRSLHLSRHDRSTAWEALKEGRVDALGMNYARLEALCRSDPDLEPGAFRFIARGPDLPNDVLLVSSRVPRGLVERLRRAFLEHEPELVAAVLKGEDNRKYRGMKIITQVNDTDYDYVRSMYRTIGYPRFSGFLNEK